MFHNYRDQHFCSDTDCTNHRCFRYPTEEVQQTALDYGLPLAYRSFKQTCPMYNVGCEQEEPHHVEEPPLHNPVH